MDEASYLIVGSNGQLGRALQLKYPRARRADVQELDITNVNAVKDFDWIGIKVILNAAAYTDVDGAETKEGKRIAWLVNDIGVANLASVASEKSMTLMHISTDYVFDGRKNPHYEDESPSPLSEYGKSKAAGDGKVEQVTKHYLLRTSWVIGEGKNFVRTMLSLGQKGISPKVVDDQVGRLTFTTELVKAIDHLLNKQVEYGTYNISNEGKPASWAEITRAIFRLAGYNLPVINTTTKDYYEDKPEAAIRPLQSTLSLDKIESTGFAPTDWRDGLREYIESELG